MTLTLLTAVLVFVHICGGYLLGCKVFLKGKISPKVILAAAVVAAAASVAVGHTGNRGYILSGVEVIFIWISIFYPDRADRRMSLFLACIYKIGEHLISLLISAGIVIKTSDISFLDETSLRGTLSFLACGILILVICFLVYYLKGIKNSMWIRMWTYLSMASLFAVNCIMSFGSDLISREDLYVWTYYALGLMISVLIVQMKKQYETEKELSRMKSDEALILEREYKALSSSYESNAKLFHDFRNHCGVIRNYLSKDKTEEAIEYLDDLTGGGSSYSSEVFTGDETIDYLIGSKKNSAEEKDIEFEVNAEFPRNINIKSSDLCAILGNLLDNAIEACSKVKDPSGRKIRLIIRRIGQMLVVKIENTYDTKPVVVDGEYKTSKTDGGLHGWGIKSVNTAASKYDGMVQSSCTDDIFTTVVTLSFEGIKT